MDLPRQLPHILAMTDKKPKGPKEGNEVAARALARWENEGGATKPKSETDLDKRVAFVETEEHILRCLGAAVVLQWNDLPTDIQRKLFEHAISMGEPPRSPELKQGIARFLHTHKDDS
jgi:hypothetical protein